ncbi:MAG: hypothetical protein ABR599_06995, partial [Gemmatimonadota bacterium]
AQPLPDPLWDRQRRRILERTVAVPPRAARARWPRLAPQAALAALAVVGLAVVYRAGVRSPDDAESLMTRSEEMARVPDSDGPRVSKLAPRTPVDAEDAAGAAGRDRPAASSVGADEQAILEMEEKEEEEEEEEKNAADVAAPAAPQRSGVTPRGRTPSEPVGSEGRTGAQRQDLPEEREAAQPRAGAPAGAAKAMTAQRSTDALSRFRDSSLAALEARDRLLAEEALAFWRDSLASGAELPEGEREEAAALADSLRALLRRP